VGRNNRQRRREKLRKQRTNANRSATRPADRSVEAAFRRAASAGAGAQQPPDAEVLLTAATFAVRTGDEPVLEQLLNELLALWDGPAGGPTVPAILGARLEEAVRTAWPAGWQPADLVRAVKRKLGTRHARLVSNVIAGEARAWRHGPGADPAWLDQLADIGADARWDPSRPVVSGWARAERLASGEALRVGVELLSALWLTPTLPLLGPPPHEWGRAGGRHATRRRRAEPSSLDPKVLGRVRALLAKAESTSFPEEAEALTAKAQQLMARHAIDQTMLEAGGEDEPGGRRLAVDDPYASAKSLLLHEVAEASRCRAVWSPDFGFSTVFGFSVDLEVVEILYTSLLVQGTTAMVAAGSAPGRGPRSRSRSFRQSFLVAYATRIGDRLRKSTDVTTAEAAETHGDALLPVLAGRSRDVDEACDRAFPRMKSRGYGISDATGYAAGVLAADQASLALGPGLESAVGDPDAA
jgi:hypothetical protein